MTVNAVTPVSDHTCPIIPEEDTLQYLAAHRILRIMVTGAFAIFGCYRLVNTTRRPPKTRPEIASGDGPPNTTQEQTGGCYRGSALPRLALLEAACQGASEDFVPPAAQRRSVRRSRWTADAACAATPGRSRQSCQP